MNSPFNKLIHFTLVSALLVAPWGTLAAASQPAKEKAVTEAKTETAAQPQTAIAGSEANPFNRLMRVAPKRHLPPTQDGIHDPANDSTQMLQTPLEAFSGLPKSQGDFGNGVDWVKALNESKIDARWDRNDPKAKPVIMDLSIVREVKGSMPGVGFPHKQHTQLLDCSNCHPAIFIPQKGANQISMAAIMLGQKCGVCHGTVAFPVAECRRCHDKAKPVAAKAPAK